jgi:hypothetical protein
LRLGKVTASRVADVVAKTKSGYSAGRANYAAQLIAERLTGTVAESYTNAAMQHGTETEPEARAAYEFYQGVTVKEVAFVPHPKIDQAGCSPDGLVDADGLVEIKCPNTATHLETLLGQAVPANTKPDAIPDGLHGPEAIATSFPTIRGCRKTCAVHQARAARRRGALPNWNPRSPRSFWKWPSSFRNSTASMATRKPHEPRPRPDQIGT